MGLLEDKEEEDQLYDRYVFNIDGLSISLVNPEIEKEEFKEISVLSKAGCITTLSMCLTPLHPVLSTFKADVDFSKSISLRLDWTLVQTLLKMKTMLMI